MKRSTATIAALLLTGLLPTARANDIVDFLRAISGPPQIHHHYNNPVPPVAHRHSHFDHYRTSSYRSFDRHYVPSYRSVRPVPVNRSRVSFNVSFGNRPTPTVHTLPQLPPPPAPGSLDHLPHEIGCVVTCPVPLATCVEYRDTCEIAPGAVPAVIAVRSPHIGRFRRCVEEIVYVQVMVPPCPLLRTKVSPCRTKIRLDYGRYEIDIVSRNGVVIVEYDD